MCVESGNKCDERRVRDGIAYVHHSVSVLGNVLRTKRQLMKEAEPVFVFSGRRRPFVEKVSTNLHEQCCALLRSSVRHSTPR